MFYERFEDPVYALYAKEISFEQGVISKKEKAILKIDFVTETLEQVMAGKEEYTIGRTFGFHVSPDCTKLLVRCNGKTGYNKKDKHLLSFFVLDDNLNLLWKKDMNKPFPPEVMQIHDYVLDNQTNIYFAAVSFPWTKEQNAELFCMETKTGLLKRNSLTTEGKYINTVWLKAYNRDIVFGGFYRDQRKSRKYAPLASTGLFMGQISSTGNVKNFNKTDFPITFPHKGDESVHSASLNTKTQEYDDLAIREISIDSLGNKWLIGEQRSSRLVQHGFSNSTVNREVHEELRHMDILIAKFKNEGSLSWVQRIVKMQTNRFHHTYVTTDLPYPLKGNMSFVKVSNKDSQEFIFMDDEGNLNLKENEAAKIYRNGTKGILVACKIDNATGKLVSKRQLYDFNKLSDTGIKAVCIDNILFTQDRQLISEIPAKKDQDYFFQLKLD